MPTVRTGRWGQTFEGVDRMDLAVDAAFGRASAEVRLAVDVDMADRIALGENSLARVDPCSSGSCQAYAIGDLVAVVDGGAHKHTTAENMG